MGTAFLGEYMNLNLSEWTRADGERFLDLLESMAVTDKIDWTKRIYNTKMPVLAIKIPILKKIAREISKGDFLSFLKLNLKKYFENILINGELISKISDFSLFLKYLDNYSKNIDNWAHCDVLKFKINNKNKVDFYKLSIDYINSKYTFQRRIGVLIWFEFILDDYIYKILDNLETLKGENEYYVNMALAWFVAELFVKRRDLAMQVFEDRVLNDFTINKAISKIRDSYRVTRGDKDMLLKYRVKKSDSH